MSKFFGIKVFFIGLIVLNIYSPNLSFAQILTGDEIELTASGDLLSAPNAKSKKAGAVSSGEKARVTKIDGKWAQIESGNKSGWVPVKALKKSAEAAKTVAKESTPAPKDEKTETAPETKPVATETPPPTQPQAEEAKKEPPQEKAEEKPVGEKAPELSKESPPPKSEPSKEVQEMWGESEKIKTAVTSIEGKNVDKELATSLTDVISAELDKLGAFKVISSEDIKKMLSFEQDKQMMGCESDTSCLAEIGGALGAELLVTGSLSKLGETFLLQLQLVRISDAVVESRVSREVQGSVSALLEDTRAATRILVRDILKQRSGYLILRATEEGATVFVDGSIEGVTPLARLELAGGTHSIKIEKEGFISWKKDIDVKQGDPTVVEATLVPSMEYIKAYEGKASTYRTLAWVSTVTGSLLVITGGVLYLTTQPKADQLDRDREKYAEEKATLSLEESQAQYDDLESRKDNIHKRDTWTYISLGSGIVLGGLGAYFFIAGDDPSRYREFSGKMAAGDTNKKFAIKARPILFPNGIGLSFDF